MASWEDADVAGFEVAVALGVFDPDTAFSTEAKHVFWSSNRLGDALSDVLGILVAIGALEFDGDDQRYRWRAGFDWHTVAAIRGR